ncbi:MAG: CocE/NonD family hydrolase [Rhodospirillales bacterium]|nr:CocE/NonD family hydrolase [Rhodospirillales bacterium]
MIRFVAPILSLFLLGSALAISAAAQTPVYAPDIPDKFDATTEGADYVKRDVMIPMRDGVKLRTVIVLPKGAKGAPMLLERTPYNAGHRFDRNASFNRLSRLPLDDEPFTADGYIRIYQDVRGKEGSEGEYVMTRPLVGPLNPTKVDHSTDAYDTIDWLVTNVPESNGKVGMIGSSYDGFTVVMAMINPHPALKVAVPMCPMIDGWIGDDWFHNGAFRQPNFDYIYSQTSARRTSEHMPHLGYDDYEGYRAAGSAGDYAKRAGLDQFPFWRKILEHPAYDSFWQDQALDKILAKQPLAVPTMWVTSIWDQEDIYGGIAAYAATEPKDGANDKNFLVLGPWRHSGARGDGDKLGVIKFDTDTALQFRRDILKPFLDQYLKDGAPKSNISPVTAYETGTNHWTRYKSWPLSCEKGCASTSKPIYLQAGFKLGFAAPAADANAGANAHDDYISDPNKPVPNWPRPVRLGDADAWRRWLVRDQRFVADRPDVLSYVSDVLTEPMRLGGAPMVNLFAATTGTDSDWVVKLIDVYPEEVPSQAELGGYQLMVAADIFRGRYRESLEHPSAIPADQAQRYRFALPTVNHVFLPGHRVMVQIQSSWFPVYDRNPQSFVPNIFLAKATDYKVATQRIYHSGAAASSIELPIVTTTR